MRLPSHHLPQELFLALSRGSGGSKAIEQLVAAEYSKHMLLVRGVLDTATRIGHDEADQVRQAYELLAAIQDHYPGAAEGVIRHPAAGSWALRALSGLLGRDGLVGQPRVPNTAPGDLARLAAAAAVQVGARFSIKVPAPGGVLALPAAGRILLPEATNSVLISSAGQNITLRTDSGDSISSVRGLRDLRGWQEIRTIEVRGGGMPLNLLVDDIDPYRMPTASPAGRLTASGYLAWQRRISEAWELLARHHRAIAVDFCGAIRVLTPLRPPPSGVRSVTSHETFGAIGMSLPGDAVTVAVTFAHEVQHAKLCALLDQVALVSPDDGRRFYAPWRPDPRPASGLLQGAYAFLGVADFWRRQRYLETGDRAVRAHAEFARWRKAALGVAELLSASGSLTDDGRVFVDGMLTTLRRLNVESVPAQAHQMAERNAGEHLARWRSRYPRLPLQRGRVEIEVKLPAFPGNSHVRMIRTQHLGIGRHRALAERRGLFLGTGRPQAEREVRGRAQRERMLITEHAPHARECVNTDIPSCR
jgi:HEXXH motif-containing protein